MEKSKTATGKKRPHIQIPENNISSSLRTPKSPPFSKHFSGSLKDHSDGIRKNLETVSELSKQRRMIHDPKQIFFKISFFNRVNEDVISKLFLALLQIIDDHTVIVALPDNYYLDTVNKIIYRGVRGNKTILQSIKSIEPITLAEKITPRMSKLLTCQDADIVSVQIEFYPNLGKTKYADTINAIEQHLDSDLEHTLSTYCQEDYGRIKIQARPSSIRNLMSGVDTIAKIDSLPKVSKGKTDFEKKSTVGRTVEPEPRKDCSTVCIIDCGVNKDHPYLKKIVVDGFDFKNLSNLYIDTAGHGTFVSGLATYGDKFDSGERLEPACKIVSAKIYDTKDEDIDIEAYIDSIVEKYHNVAKVFNLSLNVQTTNSASCSYLAQKIDKIGSKYGVLFVISAGNVDGPDIKDFLEIGRTYPDYLHDSFCNVYQPGESCNSIVVGSFALKNNRDAMAQKLMPSPFTRSGLTPDRRRKPDVVAHGGNIACTYNSSRVSLSGMPELSLASTSHDFPNSLTCVDIGTSFSAPQVARLAALLFEQFPKASPNLIKALIINSSSLPIANTAMDNLYGFGVPNADVALYSDAHRVTYIIESSIKLTNESIIKFRVPRKMAEIKGKKRMTLTLVYDPPVDYSRNYYTLVDLDLKLHKGGSGKKYDSISGKGSYLEPRSNVKQGVYEWIKTGIGVDWEAHVIPSSPRGSLKKDDSQRFALVITLEDPSLSVDIYNSVINELGIKVEDRVKVQNLVE